MNSILLTIYYLIVYAYVKILPNSQLANDVDNVTVSTDATLPQLHEVEIGAGNSIKTVSKKKLQIT